MKKPPSERARAEKSPAVRPHQVNKSHAALDFLMNAPFMQEASRALADRVMQCAADTPSRLEHLYKIAYSRNPSHVEIDRAVRFLKDSSDEQDAWRQLCQAILMANEFSLLP